MKKTKTISLILVSAVLASCNREIIPATSVNQPLDSTLLEPPEYQQVYLPSPCTSCCDNYVPFWNYTYNPFGNFTPFPLAGRYHYHSKFKRSIVYRNSKIIVRGGWGTTGITTNAVS
jgi:hypothetical protein